MPPAVKLIELCDLANRALTNGSGNTATILDPSRSGAAYWPRRQPRWTCLDPPGLLEIGRLKAHSDRLSGTNEIAGDCSADSGQHKAQLVATP